MAESGRILAGASTAIGGYALPCSVYLFREKHPGTWVDLMVASTGEIRQRPQDDLLHIAVVAGPPDWDDPALAVAWTSHVLTEDRLVLIGPVRGPHARLCRERCLPEGFRALPLIVREVGSGTRRPWNRASGPPA